MKVNFKLILSLSLVIIRSGFSQGSPGPIPPTGPYPLATGINSVMEQDVWLQPSTTIADQISAVTADALQIHNVVLPPLPSGTGTNIYTDPSTPMVTASPGPTSTSSGTSSSSSTSTSSSSSGFPGTAADHVIWIPTGSFSITNLTDPVGPSHMRSITDPHCVASATSKGWANAANAKALIGDLTEGCRRDLSGGSGVYTPALGGGFNLLAAKSWHNFMDTGPAPNHIRDENGNIVSSSFVTACHRGDPTVDQFSCYNWTSENSGWILSSPPGNTNVDVSFIQVSPPPTCSPSSSYKIYCGMNWGTSSSSSTTSSSSSTTTGGITAGDHIIWIAGASVGSISFEAAGGVPTADTICQAEAAGKGWSGSSSAKALISNGADDCSRGFSGGSKVWQPASSSTLEVIYNGNWLSLFASGPTTPASKDSNGNLVTPRLLTGCDNFGGHGGHPNSNSANWQGTTMFSSIGTPANWFVNNTASHGAYSGMSYYCALEWGGSGGSSSSTSSGFPSVGDYIMWGTSTNYSLNTIISGGGVSYMDSVCVTDATNSLYWGNPASAVALVSGAAHDCTRGLSGSGNVWTPNTYGMFTLVAPSLTALWPNGPSSGLGGWTGSGTGNFISGCGNNASTMSNCINWTDLSGSSNFMNGGTGVGANYMHMSATSCSGSVTGTWMCMIPYTGSDY